MKQTNSKPIHAFDINHFSFLTLCDTKSDDEALDITNIKKDVKGSIKRHLNKVYQSEKIVY